MHDDQMNFSALETDYLKEELSKCEDIKDLKEQIIPMIQTQKDIWKSKINLIIENSGLTISDFSELCGVSRVSVNKWRKGSIPKNRETFLKIGLMAGYNVEEMDQFLQRYGKYPALYSKSLEDCICKFVITQGYGQDSVNNYQLILNRIKENMNRPDNGVTMANITTVKFDKKLSAVKNVDELDKFITDYTAVFTFAYHKLYAYVKSILEEICSDSTIQNVQGMATIQGWSSSLKQCVSAIRQNKWYPTRNKIISLGIHLSLDHEQIDEMLKLAHMEPLCAKNVFEGVIIYILEDAELNEVMNTDSEEYDQDSLCEYTRTVLLELGLPELEPFITELPEVENDW